MVNQGWQLQTVARLRSFIDQHVHLMPGQDEEAANRTETTYRKALDQMRPAKVM